MKNRTVICIIMLILALSLCSCTDGIESGNANGNESQTSIENTNIDNPAENTENTQGISEDSGSQTSGEANEHEVSIEKEQSDNNPANTDNQESGEETPLKEIQKDDKDKTERSSDNTVVDEITGIEYDISKDAMLISEAVVHKSGGWTHFTGSAKGMADSYIPIEQFLDYVEIIPITPENWKTYFEIFLYDHCYSYINNILLDYEGHYEAFLGPKEGYYYRTPYNITFGSKSTGEIFTDFALDVQNDRIYRRDTEFVRHPVFFDDLYCASSDVVIYKINVPEEYVYIDNSEGFNKYYVNVLDEENALKYESCYEELYKLAEDLSAVY